MMLHVKFTFHLFIFKKVNVNLDPFHVSHIFLLCNHSSSAMTLTLLRISAVRFAARDRAVSSVMAISSFAWGGNLFVIIYSYLSEGA